MNGICEDFDSPEYEPFSKSSTPKSAVKIIFKKSGQNITAGISDEEADKYEIIRKNSESLCMGSSLAEEEFENSRKKITHRNRELKRLQESFIDSKDLSDPELNIYGYEHPRSRKQSKLFENDVKKPLVRRRSSRSKSGDAKKRTSSSSRSKSLTSWTSAENLKIRTSVRSIQSMTNDEALMNNTIDWAPPPKVRFFLFFNTFFF